MHQLLTTAFVVYLFAFAAVSKPVSLDDMKEGWVKGGAACHHIKDEYTRKGALGEFERSAVHTQYNLVAHSSAIYLSPDYYRSFDVTTFPGKGEPGSTLAELYKDKSGKFFWKISVEREDEKGKRIKFEGQDEVTFRKGSWDQFLKGEDVELVVDKSAWDGLVKHNLELLDVTWEIFKDDLKKKACSSCTFGPLTAKETAFGKEIVMVGNAEKLAVKVPYIRRMYEFTTKKDFRK